MQQSERETGGRTARLEEGMATATARLAALANELVSLREDLTVRRRAPGPFGWLVNEIAAWVGTLAAGTWAFGRYAVGVATSRVD